MLERLKKANDLIDSEPDEALRICNGLLNEDPNNSQAIYIMGTVFLHAERLGLAYNLYKRCTELVPHRPEPWNNLGRCLQHTNHYKEAIELFEKSLSLDPKSSCALNNIGLMYINMAMPKKALPYLMKALKYNPGMRDAIENRSLVHLMLKNWKQGWKDYDNYLGGKWRKERMYCNAPRWDGSKGQTIVVYGEQGLGDEIMFASCINELIRDSKKVFIDCEPKLKGLFKRSFPKAEVHGTLKQTELDWPKDITACVAIGSLPMFYRNTGDKFTGKPYLVPCPMRFRRSNYGKPLIGIAWNGGKVNSGEFERSIPFKDLEPILSQDADFVSLEYKPHTEDITTYEFATLTPDYDDTAALVSQMDLVISVTTTVVHLAGALGVECWCMVPKYPNWRFHLKGDTPWHKSVKSFREVDSWEPVIKTISEKLSGFIEDFHRSRQEATSGVHRPSELDHSEVEQTSIDNTSISRSDPNNTNWAH